MENLQQVADLPFYRPRGNECELFELAHENRLPLLLKGPAGCGRKRFIEYMAAGSGSKLHTITCHESLSAADLVGRHVFQGNETRWVDGPLTRAVREGAIFYLDEIAEASRDAIVVLHALTDCRQTLFIDRSGEELAVPPAFMLVASYDPGYNTTPRRLGHATRQRFLSISFDFPEPESEIAVIAAESGLELARVAPLVRLGGQIRALSGMGLEEGVSTRLLINTATLIVSGMSVLKAINAAIVEPLTDDPDTRSALQELVASVYG